MRILRTAFLLISCVVLLGSADVARLRLIPPGSQPTSEQRNTGAEQASNHGQTEKSFWRRSIHDPIAFFTLWVALFTLALAVSTTGLWVVNIRTARRQLRAYLMPGAIDVMVGNNGITVTVTLKNFGQTPASDVSTWLQIALVPPEAIPVADNKKATLGIGPRGHIEPQTARADMPADQIAGIKEGRIAAYICGRFEYRDAFKRNRYTNLRAQISNRRGNWVAVATKEGNDSK